MSHCRIRINLKNLLQCKPILFFSLSLCDLHCHLHSSHGEVLHGLAAHLENSSVIQGDGKAGQGHNH